MTAPRRRAPPEYPQIDNPATRLFWNDLEGEAGLKMCSLAAQGLWAVRMLPIMARAGGYLAIVGKGLTDAAMLATAIGRPAAEIEPLLAELETWDVFSRDRARTPYNRRMVRAHKLSEINRDNGAKAFRKVGETSVKQPRNRRETGPAKQLKTKADPEHLGETPGETLATGTHARASSPSSRLHDPSQNSKNSLVDTVGDQREFALLAVTPSGMPSLDRINGSSNLPARDHAFGIWWQAWPHKVGKGQARRAFRTALDKVDAQTLLDSAASFAPALLAAEAQYRVHPSTWLNGERWLDQHAPDEDNSVFGRLERERQQRKQLGHDDSSEEGDPIDA